MRRWKNSQLKSLVGRTAFEAVQPERDFREQKESTLLVDRSVLEYAMKHGKQSQLATYCKLRHATYLNAGIITQDMLTSSAIRNHVRFLKSKGWVRSLSRGVYQIVSMKKIARMLGQTRTAAALSLADWNDDPIAVCYGAWIACYARTWKNTYNGAAISDELKRKHFVIASAGMVSQLLGVSERSVHYWKERAWELYWQKESVRYVIPQNEAVALSIAGYDLGQLRKRGKYLLALGPNVYFRFKFHAVKRNKQW